MATIEILFIIILILFTHFIADFIMQTDKMAINKSTSIKWLSYHVWMYAVISIAFISISPWYWIFNSLAHWVIDFFTSKWTSYLWKNEKRHDFFCIVGFDQLLHTSILIITLLPFLKGV